MALDDVIKVYLDFSTNASGVLDSVTAKVDRVGDRIIKVGQGFLPFSLGAAAALGGAAKLAIDFSKALSDAQRGLDLSDAEVKQFAKSMESLQNELKYQFSSTELANIATEAGKLGVAKDEVDDFTKVVSKLAVAVDKVDKIDELSTNMAKIQTIFKLSIPELEKFGAAMNKLDDISSATADQILTFTQMAGKVGASFKVNQNVLAAYGTTLISAGAKAGEAATFMNKFLTVLAAPTNSSKPAQEAIQKLGYSVTDLARRFDKDASATMQDFLVRLNKLDNVTKRDVMGRIFGLEHIDNASLLSNQVFNLQKYLKEAGDSSGNIAKINREFEKMAEGSFEGQFRTFNNLIGEFGKQIGLVLLPGLNDILKTLQPILQKMVDFVQLHPKVSQYIATGLLIVAAFAPIVITLGAVVNGIMNVVKVGGILIGFLTKLIPLGTPIFTTFITGFWGIATAVWAAIAPFAPFIAAGVAVGLVAATIVNNWGVIEPFFKKIFNNILSYGKYFLSGWGNIFNTLGGIVQSVYHAMIAETNYQIQLVKNYFGNFWNALKAEMASWVSGAKYYGQMLIYGFIQGVQSYASSLINQVSSLMQQVRNYLPSSPAKTGALSDLDKTGIAFTETFLRGVQNSGLDSFLSSAFVSPQTDSGLAIPGANAGMGSSTTIQLTYSPQISGSKNDSETILNALRSDQRNLQKLIEDSVKKLDRRYYS